MRTLPAALTAAQRATNRVPYLYAEVRDRFGGVRRLRPTSWYSGAEASGPHAAAVPTDGSLNRLRVDLATSTLYRSRVTSPGSGSTYSSWTSFRTTTSLCAIARWGANLVAFAVDSVSPTLIYKATSADNGASWSGWTVAITHGTAVTCIAAAAKSDGNYVVIVNNGNNVSAYRWTGAAWNAAVTTTDGAVTPTGLALYYQGDYNAVVTGTIVTPGGSRVASRIFGDGFSQASNTWSVARTIIESASGSNIAYSAPFLSQPDTFRATWRDRFTGTGAWDRLATTYSPSSSDYASNLWREPAPFSLTDAYGLALSFTADTAFLTNANRVYGWTLNPATLDITADIVALDHAAALAGHAATTIDLDNSDGAYNTVPEPITRGAEVRISPGYLTLSGVLKSDGPAVWITDIEHDYTVNPPVLRLHCADAFGWLARWAATRTIQYAAGATNVFNILLQLAARAGFELSTTGGSALLANLYPALAIPAGEDGLAALRRVLARVPDTAICRGEFIYVNEPLAADASDGAYKWQGDPATYHPIALARYRDRSKPTAHVRVLGGPTAAVAGEAIDYTETALYHPGARIVADREATDATKANDRASAIARQVDVHSRDDHLEIPADCGVEPNDVIDITDVRAGLSAAKRRVLALRLQYARRARPRYTHLLALGEP